MQGIQLIHYKSLEEYLLKVQQADVFIMPCEHVQSITEHELRLKEIYQEYQVAIKNVSLIIRQFEDHKQSIRRLINIHKQCRKTTRKNQSSRLVHPSP